MNTESFAIRLPEEPQRASAGRTTAAQASDLLAQRVEEYRQARANHDRLLEYSTDYEVNPDVMARSADALRECQAALDAALSAYRKVAART